MSTDEPAGEDVTFELDGETWILIRDSDRWRIGEVRVVERWFGKNSIDRLTLSEQVSAALWVTVHRERPEFRPTDVDALEFGVLVPIVGQLAALFDRATAARARAGMRTPPVADAEEPSVSATSNP